MNLVKEYIICGMFTIYCKFKNILNRFYDIIQKNNVMFWNQIFY